MKNFLGPFACFRHNALLAEAVAARVAWMHDAEAAARLDAQHQARRRLAEDTTFATLANTNRATPN